MRNYISSVLFILVTLSAIAWVTMELEQFNTELARSMMNDPSVLQSLAND